MGWATAVRRSGWPGGRDRARELAPTSARAAAGRAQAPNAEPQIFFGALIGSAARRPNRFKKGEFVTVVQPHDAERAACLHS